MSGDAWWSILRLALILTLLRWGWGRMFVGTVALAIGLIGAGASAWAWSEPEAPLMLAAFALLAVVGAILVSFELRRVRRAVPDDGGSQRGDATGRHP